MVSRYERRGRAFFYAMATIGVFASVYTIGKGIGWWG